MSRIKIRKKTNPKKIIFLVILLVVTFYLLWNVESFVEKLF